MDSTQMGVPVLQCERCGRTHPINRKHCAVCNSPSAFINRSGLCMTCATGHLSHRQEGMLL